MGKTYASRECGPVFSSRAECGSQVIRADVNDRDTNCFLITYTHNIYCIISAKLLSIA